MSSGGWTLEPNAERDILLPWLLGANDPEVKALVVEYLAVLLLEPSRPLLEDDDSGVFSLSAVPGTRVALVWTLDVEGRQVVLAHVGEI